MAQIEGYEGLYDISESGVITNLKSGNTLDGSINSYGYRVVSLTKNGRKKDFKVHRLLATAFIPNPHGLRVVNHIDGNKLNNSLDNLEWCTHGENNIHARKVLQLEYSARPVMQLTADGKILAVWVNASVAAHFVNGSSALILACCKGSVGTAYDYLWNYAGDLFAQAIKDFQIAQVEREIERLLQTLSDLKDT